MKKEHEMETYLLNGTKSQPYPNLKCVVVDHDENEEWFFVKIIDERLSNYCKVLVQKKNIKKDGGMV